MEWTEDYIVVWQIYGEQYEDQFTSLTSAMFKVLRMLELCVTDMRVYKKITIGGKHYTTIFIQE